MGDPQPHNMGWHHVGAISIIILMGNVAVLSQMPFYRDYLGMGAMAGILVRNVDSAEGDKTKHTVSLYSCLNPSIMDWTHE